MTPVTIDEYIAGFPPRARAILRKIRAAVRKAAPGARERISYRMPCFSVERDLVYFAAFRNHIGFYPPVRDASLRRAAARYANEKGNLQFPLDKPIPFGLIARIVKARLREVRERTSRKKK